MEIEIYMPCNPDWLCNTIGAIYIIGAIVGAIAFILLLRREYKNLTKSKPLRKNKVSDRHQNK